MEHIVLSEAHWESLPVIWKGKGTQSIVFIHVGEIARPANRRSSTSFL